MSIGEDIILNFQRNEITEYHVYKLLARWVGGSNGEVLSRIAEDELRHYHIWREITGKDVKPNKIRIFFYLVVYLIFGLTFAVKLLEKGEEKAEKLYREVEKFYPVAGEILRDEFSHEEMLLKLIEEERLRYIGSIVLGLNDALVELTGSLAGFTFAMQNSKIIGVAGVILGISAALSMGASEYLSQKSEKDKSKSPVKASIYTGLVYMITVFLLTWPFFVFSSYIVAFVLSLLSAIGIIYLFSLFISVINDVDFKKEFTEMLSISMGVAVISFLVGIIARKSLGIEI